MSLFKRKAAQEVQAEKPKTLFGAMKDRGTASASRPADPVVVEKGKSFALFKKTPKPLPVEPTVTVLSVDEPPLDGLVEDVTFTERDEQSVADEAMSVAPKKGFFARKKADSAQKPVDAKPGLFSRKAKQLGDSEADTSQEPQASTVSAKKADAKAAKAEKAARTKKSTGRKPVSGKPANEIFLHTELNEGTRLWWRLSVGGLSRVEESEVSRALSFSNQDYRYSATKKLPYAQANNLALAESSEYCSLVNASGGPFGAVHATPREQATNTAWAIVPGMLALDKLLAHKLQGREPTDDIKASDAIVGFNLESGDGNSLVILFKLTGDHQLSNLQISVNAEDLGFVLNQFAQSARINSEDAPVILFSGEELLSVAGGLGAFPNEAVWQGYSVRRILTGALAISAIAAVVSGGLAATEYAKQHSLKSTEKGLQTSLTRTDEQSSVLVAEAARAFAQKTSLNHDKIFGDAQTIWMPGAKVVMDASYAAGGTRYELRMPLPQGEPNGARPSVAFALTPEKLSRLVDYKAQEGCVREGTYISGSLNEVQIIVNCQVPATPLSRYKLD